MNKPTEADISQTIALINKRLKNPDIEKPVNRPVKQGYIQTVKILAEGLDTYEAGEVTTLDYQQARAIAVLAVDYLRGECTQKVLVNVPLKD